MKFSANQTNPLKSGGCNPVPTTTSRHQSPADVAMPEWGLTLIESHHTETFHMEMGHWPFHKVCWIPVGRGLLELTNGSIPIRRDDFLLLPSGTVHRFVDHPGEPLTLVIVCFTDDLTQKNASLSSVFGALRSSHPVGFPLRAANAYHESQIKDLFKLMLREQGGADTGYEAASQAAFTQLIVRMLRSCARESIPVRAREQALEGAIQYMEENFYKPIALRQMADRCGVTSRRFTDLFKQRMGTTFVDYLNRKRVAYAAERIRETGNILYACYEAGFQDLGYFYRVYRRYTGHTPGDRTTPN